MFIILYHVIALHFQNSNNSESNSNNDESLLLIFWWPLESEGTVCYYHVMYAFQREDALCSFLNVKKRLPQNRCDIWRLQTKWLWVWIPLLSHLVLCLNAFAKLQNTRVESRQPVLMVNCPTCLYVLDLLVYWMVCLFQVVQAWHEILWLRKSHFLKRKLTRNICR